MSTAREIILQAFRRIIHIYFRDIEVVGAPPADTRGRIFGANHVNGIVDPLVVLTSTEARIAPIAKATLWKVPVLSLLLDVAEAVPVVRRRDDPSKAAGSNDEVFDTVAEHLESGKNILIFPEGTSHNEPHVVPIKSGAGRMLARARERGVRGLTFQAVALEFDARDTFRSRALVVYGPIRAVDDLDASDADLPNVITEKLREDLTELVVEGDTWEERKLIARVAQLLAHDAGHTSLAEWNVIGRRVEAARKALVGHDDLYDQLSLSVGRYYDLLDTSGLTDDRLMEGGSPHAAVVSGAVLFALLPFALLGSLLYYVPYQLPKLASAIAKGDTDVVSTYKLGIGLLAFPIWLLLLLALSALVLPAPYSYAAMALSVASPLAALPWLDRIDRSRIKRRPRGVRPGEIPSRDVLVEAREQATKAIAHARSIVEAAPTAT